MVGDIEVQGSWITALVFGVSSAMLGVSGFESSSQVSFFVPRVCVATMLCVNCVYSSRAYEHV